MTRGEGEDIKVNNHSFDWWVGECQRRGEKIHEMGLEILVLRARAEGAEKERGEWVVEATKRLDKIRGMEKKQAVAVEALKRIEVACCLADAHQLAYEALKK